QEQVVALLQNREVLLVLDNCEHLSSACAMFVQAVLERCTRVRVLATSREVLKCQDEAEWPLPPLDLPPPDLLRVDDPYAVARIRTYAAVELFIERARAAVGAFDLTSENAVLVARICRRLDGLPLALELASRYVKVLSLQQIDDGIATDVRFLAAAHRTAAARHQTLHAAINWSYRRLSRREQRAFRRLCVLAGDFGARLAAAVCDVAYERMITLLLALVDASLVQVVRHADTPRYRILETIKQFGTARLIDEDEHTATYERYCQWTEAYVVAASSQEERANPRVLLDDFEREHEHLRAALLWMHSQGRATQALRLALRLL